MNQFLIFISFTAVSFFVVGLLGTMILARAAGMELSEISDAAKWDFTDPKMIFLLRGMQVVQFVSLFLIPSFLCAWFFSSDTKKYLGLNAPSNKIYIIAGIAVLFLSIPFITFLGELNKNVQFPSGIENWMRKSENDAAKIQRGLLSKHSITDLISNLVCIAGLAAIGEELLFRGMAQRLLTKIFKSPWAGILIAAFLFSAFHMQFYGFLPRFVLGILLGAMYWYSGSLWVAIIAHFVYDAFILIMVYYKPAMMDEQGSVKISSLALAGAVSAVLVILSVRWMIKRSSVNYKEVYTDDAIPPKDQRF